MTAVRPILVGVVEDHPLYRAAVARVLAEAPDVEVGELAESVAHFAAGRHRRESSSSISICPASVEPAR